MYCSQCGKKVTETMLFCPFCGSPIVIPDQDEQEKAPGSAPAEPKGKVEEISAKLPEKTAGEIEFVPLDVDHLMDETVKDEKPASDREKGSDVLREVSETLSAQLNEEPVRLQGRTPDLSAARPHSAPKISSRKNAQTHVPQRQFNPNDMFLDGEDEEEYEDFEEEYEFEEPEHGSFFVRHIRGFVSLIMFAVVAAVLVGWAFSPSGQQALARAGLAWRPEVYAEAAYSAYANGSYALAGSYYAEALERDSSGYDYANSAAVAYYMANDSLKAEAMARKAIEVNPARAEAYQLLQRLYPNADTRPADIQSMLELGYQLTGGKSPDPKQ